MGDWVHSVIYDFNSVHDRRLHEWMKDRIGYGKRLKGNNLPADNLPPTAEWYFRSASFDAAKTFYPNGMRVRGSEYRTYFFKNMTGCLMFKLGWSRDTADML